MVKRFLERYLNVNMKIKTNFMVNGSFDVVFACLVMILYTIGLVSMYSASYVSATVETGSGEYYLYRQILWGIIGFGIMLFVSHIDYKAYNSGLASLFYIATIFILAITLLVNKIQNNENGRWLGPVQPSEFAKITLIIVLAYFICAMKNALRTGPLEFIKVRVDPKKFNIVEEFIFNHAGNSIIAATVLAIILASYCVLVLLGSHYSGAIVLFSLGLVMCFFSGAKKSYFVIISIILIIAIVYILNNYEILKGFGNAYTRIHAWLKPDEVSPDDRYQTNNGLYAIASGGFFGVGFGQSRQKNLYVPEPHNDFVFSIFCEERGIFGACIVLILFAALVLRGIYIAVNCKNYFGSLLAIGVVTLIAIQVIFNMAVITDLFPNTGMPLPFFSYGGSSLWAIMIGMGIVLSVSRDANMEK